MAASSSTTKEGITFGVELEILVPFLWPGQVDPAGDNDERHIIRLPQQGESPSEEFYSAQDKIKTILGRFLRTYGVPVYDNGIVGAGPPTKWSIGSDSTVRENKFTSYYRFAGIEIRSPALLAQSASFAEVKRVVGLLRTHFRLRVNETTGFHVHVGTGAQKLPPQAVRRLSQFLWCAEGMLSQLHPPERMMNQFCPSIRHSSHLARGRPDHYLQAEEQSVQLGEFFGRIPIAPAVDKESPTAVSDRLAILQQNPNSFPSLDAWSDTSRAQRLSPVRTNPYQNAAARQRHQIKWGRELTRLTGREFLEQELLHPHEVGMPRLQPEEMCTSVLEGLQILCQPELYANTNRSAHELSGYVGQRFSYNLLAYDYADSGDVEMRRTIEFREAAGTVHPTWVAAWARICSRIVEFCLTAEEDTFVDVLMRTLEAELAFKASRGTSSRYDVIDLISSLDLRDEAKFVQEKILLGDKDAFWFPCALEENPENEHSSASIILPRNEEN